MRLRCDTLPAKKTPDRSTSPNTRFDKSAVATTVPTVASITTDDYQGLVRSLPSEPQEKVLIDTMTMTAVSAVTGTTANSG
jgi:hypothetical protein